jgi:CRISPR-associated protein Cmr2
MTCARSLHDAFETTLAKALSDLGDGGPVPTLSIGIGIGHHLDEMAAVRALAKRAERAAKQFPSKDALAVHVQMRSGGSLEVVDGFASQLPLDARIQKWASLLLAEAIPGKAAHDLEAEMAPLLHGGASPELTDVARSLATRVLVRKRGEHGEEKLSENVRSLMDAPLVRGDVARGVHQLSHELQIAGLVADALRVAFERPTKEA